MGRGPATRALALILVSAAIAACLRVGAAHAGWGHGGGPVPPGLRDPEDPAPPPPPPLRSWAGPWEEWWARNADAILRAREILRRPEGMEALGEWSGPRPRPLKSALRRVVVPALRRVLDRCDPERASLRASACVALAKLTEDPADVDRLLEHASLGPSRGARADEREEVRMAATLALGCLRRSDAERKFDASTLDFVRDACLSTAEDEVLPAPSRLRTVVSLGLLGDQPTLRQDWADRLFHLLCTRPPDDLLAPATLMALSRQGLAAPETIEGLESCLLRGRLPRYDADERLRAAAALALGRLRDAASAPILREALATWTTPAAVKRAVVVALGTLASGLEVLDHDRVSWELVGVLRRDPFLADVATVSLGRILAAEARLRGSGPFAAGGLADVLVARVTDRDECARPFAALATAMVVREIRGVPEDPATSAWRDGAVEALRRGSRLSFPRDEDRAAFASARGLAGDPEASDDLVRVFRDPAEDRSRRGIAALLLGTAKARAPEALDALAPALRDGAMDGTLRGQAAVALALLGRTDVADRLLASLAAARDEGAAAAALRALGILGDVGAVPALVEILEGPSRTDSERELACEALACLCDPEPVPSLTALWTDGWDEVAWFLRWWAP